MATHVGGRPHLACRRPRVSDRHTAASGSPLLQRPLRFCTEISLQKYRARL